MSKLTDIDLMLDASRGKFRAAQIEHLEQHGRYWQGPVTHDSVPITTAAPRHQDQAVSISGKTWRDMLPGLADARLPFRARCDEYESTQGRGYQLRVEAVMSGQTWVKVIDFGPNAAPGEWVAVRTLGVG